MSTVSEKLRSQIGEMLNVFGINPMKTRPHKGKRDKNDNYGLVIYRKNDIEKFISEIGFSSPKHKTKIEIWRKLGYCPPKTTISERLRILNNINT